MYCGRIFIIRLVRNGPGLIKTKNRKYAIKKHGNRAYRLSDSIKRIEYQSYFLLTRRSRCASCSREQPKSQNRINGKDRKVRKDKVKMTEHRRQLGEMIMSVQERNGVMDGSFKMGCKEQEAAIFSDNCSCFGMSLPDDTGDD